MSDEVTTEPAAEAAAVKYPDVHVQLTGEDGNIFSIMGRVTGEMRRAGVSAVERNAYTQELMDCGSYDEALRVTMRWVSTS